SRFPMAMTQPERTDSTTARAPLCRIRFMACWNGRTDQGSCSTGDPGLRRLIFPSAERQKKYSPAARPACSIVAVCTMPKRTDIHSVLIIGAGPIIIGQACEFDYSGTQACKALREEGYRVILINSNPATIMTDPEFADRTYIEPI